MHWHLFSCSLTRRCLLEHTSLPWGPSQPSPVLQRCNAAGPISVAWRARAHGTHGLTLNGGRVFTKPACRGTAGEAAMRDGGPDLARH